MILLKFVSKNNTGSNLAAKKPFVPLEPKCEQPQQPQERKSVLPKGGHILGI